MKGQANKTLEPWSRRASRQSRSACPRSAQLALSR